MFINECVKNALIVYIGIVFLIYLNKPKLMFKEDGELKKYGLGRDKTLFSFPVCCITLAIITFFATASITELFSKIKIIVED